MFLTKNILISLLIFSSAVISFGQYVIMTDDYGVLYKYYYDDCRAEVFCDTLDDRDDELAIYPSSNENLFFSEEDQRPIFRKIDTNFCSSARFKIHTLNGWLNCIEFDEDGRLWGIGAMILIYNPSTGLFEERKRYLTYDRTNSPESTAFFRYKNEFYWVSGYDSFFKLDTNDIRKSQFLFSCPVCDSINYTVNTIFKVRNQCNPERIICIVTGKGQYEVNMETGQFTLLCAKPDLLDTVGITGVTTPWFTPPHYCDVLVDLDLNGSSGDMQNGYNAEYLCQKNTPFVSDTDLVLFSDYGTMDSVLVTLTNPLDGSNEAIVGKSEYSVNVINYTTNKLLLTPMQQANNDSLGIVLKKIYYSNTSCPLAPGIRIIEIIAYKNGRSDTARCDMHVGSNLITAGRDNAVRLCKNDSIINLFNLLGSCYTTNGNWDKLSNQFGMFDPQHDPAGYIHYIIQDSICGADTANIYIQVNINPKIDLGTDQIICANDSLHFVLDKNFTYQWQDGRKTNDYLITKTGLYWVEVIDSSSCKSRDSIFVDYQSYQNKELIQWICYNSTYEYHNKSYRVGDIIYDTLKVSGKGCDTLQKIQIMSYPIPKFDISGDTLICKGKSTKLQCNPFFKYLWSTGEQNNSITAFAGQYSLTVTDQNFCTFSKNFIVKEAEPVNYQIDVIQIICPEDKGSINIDYLNGGIQPVRYFLNGQLSTTGLYEMLDPGTYLIKIEDALACSQLDTVVILGANNWDVDIVDELELDQGATVLVNYKVINKVLKLVRVTPTTGIKVETNGLSIIGDKDIEYHLIFEDSDGCIINKILTVTVKENTEVYVPTAFSPNGDQLNDSWKVKIGSSYDVIAIQIFDRWGNMVYHSIDRNDVWDGKFKNQLLNPGVYVYNINIKNKNGQIKNYSGDLTLIR